MLSETPCGPGRFCVIGPPTSKTLKAPCPLLAFLKPLWSILGGWSLGRAQPSLLDHSADCSHNQPGPLLNEDLSGGSSDTTAPLMQ